MKSKVLGLERKPPVFVVGTGRSGTHWLAETFSEHPEVHLTVEKNPMFSMATKMALTPDLEKKLYPILTAAYKLELLKASSRVYMDKSCLLYTSPSPRDRG